MNLLKIAEILTDTDLLVKDLRKDEQTPKYIKSAIFKANSTLFALVNELNEEKQKVILNHYADLLKELKEEKN
jgi:hypothetical protein